jgi:hypothetical protein
MTGRFNLAFVMGCYGSPLGQQPDVLSCLSAWIQDLGDHSYKPTTISSASAHLRTLLHDKRMLLVVDDVWDPSHAEPFRVGGSNCCVLVTTREARIPGCLRYDLDVMTPEQALALLSHAIQEKLTETAMQEALALAKAVAYLPLALELAAAQIQDGATWAELLEALQREIADLDILDIQGFGFESQTSKQRNLSLLASFNLSLKRLPPEQLKNFAWLGVLPEDITITEQMAATLWDMSPHQARTLLRFFKSRALLLSGGRLADQRLGYRLHDLMHDVARHLLVGSPTPEEPGLLPGLGLTLAEAHRAFLDRYRRKLQDGLWHTVPSDGYIQSHLTWHLEQGELVDEIHLLLQEENAEGKNGWYIACRESGQIAIFVNDVARAWRLAEELFITKPSQALSLQCRYMLLRGALNTWINHFPPELIAVLVSQKIWQPAQGLAYLQQSPDPWRQLRSFQKLLPYIPDSLLMEALGVAQGIPDRVCRSVALIELSTRLPELQPEARHLVGFIQEDFQKALAYGKLAEQYPELWPQALKVVRSIQPEREQGPLLRELAPHLPDALLKAVFEMAEGITDAYSRAIGMAALTQRLPETKAKTLAKNLESVREIDEIYGRAWAMAALSTVEPDLWTETLEDLGKIEHEAARARLIRNFSPYLPDHLLSEVIKIGREIEHEYRQVMALGSLTARQPELWVEVLQLSEVIREEEMEVKALCSLASKVEHLWPMALEMTKHISYEHERAVALAALADYWPELWPEARQTVLGIKDAYDRGMAFEALGSHMPDLWPYALEATRAIQDALGRVILLQKLAPKMPALWPETVRAIDYLWFERQQAIFIYRLIFGFPNDCLSDLIQITRSMRDDFERVVALSALAIRVPEVVDEATVLLASLSFDDEQSYHRAIALSALAIRSPHYWPDAIAAIAAIEDEGKRATALYEIAPKLPESIVEEVFQIAFSTSAEFHRANAIRELLPRLDLSKIDYKVWCEICQTISFLSSKNILELIPHLSDSIEALGGEAGIVEVAHAIRDVARQW